MAKIYSKKSKTATMMIAASLVIGLILLSSMTVLPNVGGQLQTNIGPVCIDKAEKLAQAMASSLDETKARLMANSSSAFNTKTHVYIVTNKGEIFHEFTIDRTSCTPIWKYVHVGFFLNDTKGYAENLVFTLDPALKTIVNVEEYRSGFAYIQSRNWDGYEFGGNSSKTLTVYKAQAVYNQPAISQPTGSGQPTCTSTMPCKLSTWTGLEAHTGGTTGLVQTGSIAEINYTGATPDYHMFWEAIGTGSSSMYCGSINNNDQISAKVTNEGLNSTNTSNYDIYTVDANSGLLCYAKVTSYEVTNPTLATFINEIPSTGPPTGPYYPLPNFGTDTIQGYMYYNGALNSISVPYNAGYYNDIQMWSP